MRLAVTAVLLTTALLMSVPVLLPMNGPAITYAASHGGDHGKGRNKATPWNNLWYPFVTLGGLCALVLYTTRRPKD